MILIFILFTIFILLVLKDITLNVKNKEDKQVTVTIKYHDEILERVKITKEGDWIDLRAAETVKLKKGEFKLISLGVSMQLPEGYEAHMVPRSSTFKNFKIIQTNHMGIIDESYSGDSDIFMFPAYALENTIITKNDRICQFRIMKHQPKINFETVSYLNFKNRGGHGSSGVK